MINDELKKIWQSSPQGEKVKFEKSRLILELQSSMDTLHKKIKARDIGEYIGVLIVIPVFIYYAITIPFLLTKIASILIAIWACYVAFRLRQTKNAQPSEYDDNYLNYLEKNKQYLQKQKQLLDQIFWWYIAPFICFLTLFLVGLLEASQNTTWIVMTLIIGIFLSIIIYLLNKKYAKQEFETRINKIEDLIKVMKEEE